MRLIIAANSSMFFEHRSISILASLKYFSGGVYDVEVVTNIAMYALLSACSIFCSISLDSSVSAKKCTRCEQIDQTQYTSHSIYPHIVHLHSTISSARSDKVFIAFLIPNNPLLVPTVPKYRRTLSPPPSQISL